MSESLDYDLISMKNKVQFVNIEDQYNSGTDLSFQFKLDDYTPEEGDRIGIFKVGWSSVRDYQIFEWVPLDISEEVCTVIFQSKFVRKIKFEDGDFFQLCYLGRESEIYGVSSPFQFISNESRIRISLATGDVNLFPGNYTMERATRDYYEEKNRNYIRTKDENRMLRERNQELEDEVDMLKTALKAAQSQPIQVNKNYDEVIATLQQTTEDLKKADRFRQSEIDMLKKKITEIKEVFIKLNIEKNRVERKYKTLKNKKSVRTYKRDEETSENDDDDEDFDITNLDSIPPFPIPNSILK